MDLAGSLLILALIFMIAVAITCIGIVCDVIEWFLNRNDQSKE